MSINLQSQAVGESHPIMGLVRRQFTKPVPLPTDVRLTDQIAIVTGSNAGVGLAASRQLLSLGLSRLIMGVRSQSKGDKVAADLRKEYPKALVSVWILDMESYDSIQAFVDQCGTLPHLDIVILNAGFASTEYRTVPGTDHESTIQVNYLSTSLLAILLVPVLKRSPKTPGSRPPVLSLVGSDAMYMVAANDALISPSGLPVLKRFDDPKKFSMNWYSYSKLLLLSFVWKLSESVSSDEVIINVCNPGMTTGTEFFTKAPFMVRLFMGMLQAAVARPLAVGATNYISAVTTLASKSHGSFVSDWTIKSYPSAFYTEEGKQFRDRLWDETIEELKTDVGASKILESLKK